MLFAVTYTSHEDLAQLRALYNYMNAYCLGIPIYGCEYRSGMIINVVGQGKESIELITHMIGLFVKSLGNDINRARKMMGYLDEIVGEGWTVYTDNMYGLRMYSVDDLQSVKRSILSLQLQT